jgi:NTP pyrophosphatase (non-canonical NTP hydrolase)
MTLLSDQTMIRMLLLGTRAIRKWGVDAQVGMAIEECAELIVALRHVDRGREANVASEIADVLITCCQMACIVGVDKVASEVERKLCRLSERLDQ